jgi:hypothetical protein
MTNEEMQKAIEFIVEHEARSSATIDAIAEAQKGAEQRWAQSEERWTRTEESIRALLSIAEIHEREVQANTQQILSLGETTRATDERLNALIHVVERQISDGRNGKP